MENLMANGIAHVGYVVKDLQKTVAHFETQCGLPKFMPFPIDPFDITLMGVPSQPFAMDIAFIPPTEKGPGFELIQPLSLTENNLFADFVNKTGGGMHHLAFQVADYEAWKTHYQKLGMDILLEFSLEDDKFGFRRRFYVQDTTAGLIAEIMEPAYFRNK